MGQKRGTLEWQLSRASTELSSCEKDLDQKGIAADARKRNPKWRNLNARCRQLRNRINAVSRVEAINQEVLQRKTAAAAAVTEA